VFGRLQRLERIGELTRIGPAQVVEGRSDRWTVMAHERYRGERHDGSRSTSLEHGRPQELRSGAVRWDRGREQQILKRERRSRSGQPFDRCRVVVEIEVAEDPDSCLA